MYTVQDLEDNRRQLRGRRLAVALPAAALLALAAVAFLLRWHQAAAVAFTALGGSLIIFGHTLLIAPVAAYGRHISHALNGRTRDTRGAFVALEEEAVLREGLSLYPMTINVGGSLREDGTRLFYLDAHLPRPDWQAGEELILTSYDNRVTAWRRAEKSNDTDGV